MSDEAKFSVIFDPTSGFQLLNNETGEVADMAVLEGTWRKRGTAAPEHKREVATPTHAPLATHVIPSKVTTVQYGGLRIRSAGLHAYDIADPRMSFRDGQD